MTLLLITKRVKKRLPVVVPGCDWLFQVVALREAVPDEVVPSVLGGRVVVEGGMSDKRTREPTDLPVQDRDRRLNGLAPVVTHGFWGGGNFAS